MTLMIYLLSLAVAGYVLYLFPFQQNSSYLVEDVALISVKFSQWFALNFVLVSLVAVSFLQWPVFKQRISSHMLIYTN